MATTTETLADEKLRQRELERIAAQREPIAEICRRYGVASLSLFGSIRCEGEFKAESDIDMLIEFKPGVTHGLSFFSMEIELTNLLGRKVDLNTIQDLSRYFRDAVTAHARPIYECDHELPQST